MLTEHFSETELAVADCEERIQENARFLCQRLLEPIRAHYNAPVRVHCGFRDYRHNAAVGGKSNSFHLFEDGHAAADIDVEGVPLSSLFDWLRLDSKLPIDKVILESSPATHRPACVHIQIDRFNGPRRMALVGSTGAAHDYQQVACV